MAISHQNIEYLVQKLNSSSPSTLKKTLASVAKITKRHNEAEIFRRSAGLVGLIALLKRPNNSIIDMTMSSLANCSMFPECKKEIRQLDGILPIVSVLKNLKTTSVLNRTARALANLGEDNDNAIVIEELGAIEELARLLDETTDPDCQQSVLRGLKILCTTPSRKRIVVEQGCLKVVVELLKSEKQTLQSGSIKALSELTKNCSKELAMQLQEFDGIKEIIKLTNSEKQPVCTAAVMSIVNLCVHAYVRVSIGSEGGITMLYQQAKLNSSSHLSLKALEGLCYCCREAVNRNRVYECGGIELLLKHFTAAEHHSLQRKIITAFNCFYYNEKCLEFLLNGGIVSALLSYLTHVIQTCHIVDHCVDDHDHFDHESFTSDFSSPSSSPRHITPGSTEGSNISLNETFLEEATNLAIQVRDANESNRMLTFKRKRGRLLSTPSPSAKPIDQSSVLFSFSSLDCTTETTSMMTTCTLSSKTSTSPFTPIHSHPRTVICSTSSPREENFKSSPEEFLTNLVLNKPSPDVKSPKLSPDSQSGIEFDTVEGPKTCAILSQSNASSTKDDSPKVMVMTSLAFSSQFSSKSSPALPQIQSPLKDKELTVSHHAVHGPGHSALVLLSRFSQMVDKKGLYYLLTKPCMKVLLDYLSLIDNPSPKCARLLNYLTLDPQCFESLVSMGVACEIHRQLCEGWMDSCFDNKKLSSSNLQITEDYVDSCNKNASLGNLEVNKICLESSDYDKTSPNSEDRIQGHDLAEHSVRLSYSNDNQKLTTEKIPESSKPQCKSVGSKLLDNLACQSQTPFGKGVLMHLLSKVSSDERLESLTGVPFICRSKKLQHQLLIVKGGLKMLCDGLLSSCSDKVFGMTVYALSFLSVETELSFTMPVSNTTQSADTMNIQDVAQVKFKRGKRKLFPPRNTQDEIKGAKSQKVSSTESLCTVEESKEKTACKYQSNDLGPFDIQLETDSGLQIPAHRAVLANTSDMFNAMFSSYYKEGSMPKVHLKEVTHNVLVVAVHKAYGCSFPNMQECRDDEIACGHVTEILNAFPNDTRYEFLIEVLAMADKFLMLELKSFCEHVLPSYVNELNLVSLCVYAAHYHSQTLCTFGMKFLLLNIKDFCKQYNLSKLVFKSVENVILVQILYEMLLKHLQGKLL